MGKQPMTLLSKTDLLTLASTHASHCVSIYLPTHEAGQEIQQDPIRLKNQLSVAEDRLIQSGLGAKEAQRILEPAAALLDEQSFWQHQSSGLALFITPEQLYYYRVPVAFETMTVVGDRFHVKPLLPLITNDGQFYILAASQNKVSLYQATRDSVQSVDLGNTPLSKEVALRYDDPQASLQGHSGSSNQSPQGGSQIVSGQGGGKDSENTDILRFFHLVSDGVEKVLGGQSAPLIFMGVEFLFPLYRSANKYPHLMAEAVDFQPDQLSPTEVRDRALEVVAPHFSASRKAASERYGSLKASDQASSDLAVVLNAAENGQIDSLLIAKGVQRWGHFDATAREVSYHDEQISDSQDLLNIAAIKAFATDASVYLVDRADMPEGADIAATLRYPIMQTELVSA